MIRKNGLPKRETYKISPLVIVLVFIILNLHAKVLLTGGVESYFIFEQRIALEANTKN